MWCIWVFICLVLINFSSSLPTTTNNELYHYRQISSLQSTDQTNNNNTINLNVSSINNQYASSNICSIESSNINILVPGTHTHSNTQHSSSATITAIGIIPFISSWQRKIVKDDGDHSARLNVIQIIFTIPYTISNESIVNKTVFITDVIHNQLLTSSMKICINASSFIINYSTTKLLPHNICLYLLLNLTSSTILREIIFCRIIDYLYDNSTSSPSFSSHTVGPSGFFILSQCIIILLMMFVIYGVQTARQKSLINRVGQRLVRSRPYIIVFGDKTAVRPSSNTMNASLNPATTLQAGCINLLFIAIWHQYLVTKELYLLKNKY